MSRVAQWNKYCNNSPKPRKTREWKYAMLNQLARIQEELNETIAAVNEEDELEVLDGLVDLQVVLEGAAFLSGLPVEKAFDLVMDNNDLKYTVNYEEAYDAWVHMGVDKFNIQEYSTISGALNYSGMPVFSVHRNYDNKICKLLNHPKVDLSVVLED